ncbi:autotransporter outer membrane beta-barrel domain-containing protein [Spirosoma taeanense]|nr:bZIP transcription factor [Spirosoma taeanense]
MANNAGNQNTLIGYQAGMASTASANTMLGYRAGASNTTGQFNTFMGVQAGVSNTTGSSNFIMGTNAGSANTTGSANFFLGDNAGAANTTGGFNVYLGSNAGNGSGVNGSNNTAIGFEAGRLNSGGNTNTFVGFRADAGFGNLTNATALGTNARVDISNALVLGSGVNVGIGNSSPSARLHLTSGVANNSGLRLENLTSASPAATNASKFLTVDGSGNVVLANYVAGARVGADGEGVEALWQRKGDYLQSLKGEAIIIGQGVSKTPSGYSLYVGQGILTEKVKVAVRNTAEWSDYVFGPTYKLRSLGEVETYIQQHQHLPGVPSAQQMVEQGNDLHQTDAKLLEKIEELTLYMIEQRTELKALQAQNKQMKKRLSLLEAKPKR